MNKTCVDRLLKIKVSGTPLNIQMATYLLNEQPKIDTIIELSKLFKAPLSSTSRFIGRLGYNAFQHFLLDYNEIERHNEQSINTEVKRSKESIDEVIKYISNSKSIHIMTSRKDKAIGKFVHERLNDGGVVNYLYSESSNKMKQFIENIKPKDCLVMIDLIGESYIISNAFTLISKAQQEAPNKDLGFCVIIITAAKWVSAFHKYDFIHVERLMDETVVQNVGWKDYNHILKNILPVFLDIMDEIKK